MRAVEASLVAVVLLSLIAVCPLTACVTEPDSVAVHHSCCHKSQQQPMHCPMPTVQDCAYFILEKGKTTQPSANLPPAVFERAMRDPVGPDPFSNLRTETRIPDWAGLYLRVRALLI